ncbi:RidA family protein [Magnetospirillum sp. 15-1]|uniref:RidA family protein n=1 Tax=Magnetospirillum sp. 15-1 TaxID=1979370 RepID=UPI000BBC76C1|nr:RidA family protein [Magnetospirillum sp. 15-1]
MTRQLISSGSSFEEVAGYSRAVRQDPWVFVSGTSGFKDGKIAEDVVAQAEQCMATIAAALEQAGSSLKDVVRVKAYITEAAFFEKIAPVLGKAFKGVRPANTTIVCGLVDPQMKVEIEVTALKA